MRVEIVNDNQNWLNWGTLVQIWIADPNQRPTALKELKDQMDAHNVCGTVAGPDSRPVQIEARTSIALNDFTVGRPKQDGTSLAHRRRQGRLENRPEPYGLSSASPAGP
jgi:hypothetical protein